MSEDASYEVEVPVIGASFFIDVSGVFIEGFRLEVYNIGRGCLHQDQQSFLGCPACFFTEVLCE